MKTTSGPDNPLQTRLGWLDRLWASFSCYSLKEIVKFPYSAIVPTLWLGRSIFLATFIATVIWGIAGWRFASALELHWRLAVAGGAALTGMLVVMIWDKSALFFLDTAPKGRGFLGKFSFSSFLVIRFLISALICSLTSQVTIPLFLHGELQGQALKMIEESEKNRQAEQNRQAELNLEKKPLFDSLLIANQIENLRQATVPKDIDLQLKQAESCTKSNRARYNQLLGQGVDRAEINRHLRVRHEACAKLRNDSNKAWGAWRKGINEQLALKLEEEKTALKEKQGLLAEQNAADAAIKAKIERAADMEAKAYTAESAEVLEALLQQSTAAFYKWLAITTVLMVLELMPFVLKLLSRQTPMGTYTALEHEKFTSFSEADFMYAITLNRCQADAHAALEYDPGLREEFLKSERVVLLASAPIARVITFQSDLAAHLAEKERLQRACPEFAGLLSGLWNAAVQESYTILTSLFANRRFTQDGNLS
ncbi:MAG: hypothetical protein LBR88_08695 [Zoogloeaceae bacterium]|nr:hypothetical protein [Zoogloeaceae bacterium]